MTCYIGRPERIYASLQVNLVFIPTESSEPVLDQKVGSPAEITVWEIIVYRSRLGSVATMSLLRSPIRKSTGSSSVLLAIRYASTSASSSSRPKASTASSVQRADEQLALRQKQQAAMRRSGRQMDLMSANIQVLGMFTESGPT